jgi:hypothetical protein
MRNDRFKEEGDVCVGKNLYLANLDLSQPKFIIG